MKILVVGADRVQGGWRGGVTKNINRHAWMCGVNEEETRRARTRCVVWRCVGGVCILACPPGEAFYVCFLPSTHYHNSNIKARAVGCRGKQQLVVVILENKKVSLGVRIYALRTVVSSCLDNKKEKSIFQLDRLCASGAPLSMEQMV